ncbi:MAG: hypothetical protein CVV27_13525 [Candidatus Melainabacteria bacterium HGW-Melainabacteria-1]|nr:MAG: hypothetical protein CVV27_13525 [Candidatus Melainabacteria bacterium HGW-Melainabacteria-1]
MSSMLENQIPKYSVKQAAELSGLTLNQVRLWERRYKLVEPQRAANGYRLYSQDDLEILRYARRETQKSVSIQVVADRILQDRPSLLASLREEKRITPQKIFSSDPRRLPNYDLMLHAVANGDPLKFERLLIQAQAGKNFAESLRTVDLPILARIGELTTRKEINIASSHLASAIIRRRILSHVQNLGMPRGAQPVLLACAPNDYHELGLLCCMLELTQELIASLYLGPNVPLKEVLHYCDKVNPLAVLISVIAPQSEASAHEIGSFLRDLNQRVPVGLGGFEAEKQRELFESYGLTCFKGVEDVLDWPVIAQSS